MRRRQSKRRLRWLVLFSAIIAVGLFGWANLRPTEPGRRFFVRYASETSTADVLKKLQEKGVIRSAAITGLVMRISGTPPTLRPGTYTFAPGDSLRTLRREFAGPMRRRVRLREMRWIARTAEALQREGVCPADDYRRVANDAAPFRKEFPFVPEAGSLEGYLMPDTYDLPPLTPAEEVVRMQLRAFSTKIEPLIAEHDRRSVLTAASLVEMEASDPEDRRRIAGVIENRLAKGMRLQIDATVNYGRQKWGRLYYKDYKGVKSPYNTYLVKGLPPGPICSPSADAVRAVLSPIESSALYYVALPTGKTIYATTFTEHQKNIALRRAMIAESAASGGGKR